MKSVGKQLQEARLAKSWTPELAARETKIKVERVRDLEADDYSHFSSPTYARGFVRTYARALNIDEYRILRQLDNKLPEDDNASFVHDNGLPYMPETARAVHASSANRTGLYVVLGLGLGVLLVSAFVLLQAYRAGELPRYFAADTPANAPPTNAPPVAETEGPAHALPVDANDTTHSVRALPVNLNNLAATETNAAPIAPTVQAAAVANANLPSVPGTIRAEPVDLSSLAGTAPTPAVAAPVSSATMPPVANTATPATPAAGTIAMTPGAVAASPAVIAAPAPAEPAVAAVPTPAPVRTTSSARASNAAVPPPDPAPVINETTTAPTPPPVPVPSATTVPAAPMMEAPAAATAAVNNAPAPANNSGNPPGTETPGMVAPRALPVDPSELVADASAPGADATVTAAPVAETPLTTPVDLTGDSPTEESMAEAHAAKQLVLTASRDSFIRVTSLDGSQSVLYASVLRAGQSLAFGGHKFSVNVGVPSAVDIDLDGVNYGPHSDRDSPETFTLESHER